MVPERFSVELGSRLGILLKRLAPIAAGERLTTTFALAMAMPLIVIPYERTSSRTDMNELSSDKPFADDFAKLRASNFYDAFISSPRQLDNWRFMVLDARSKDISIDRPGTWKDQLGRHPLAQGAVNQIKEQTVDRIAYTVRNALSHATVVYLSEEGLEQPNRQVTHLAFVSRLSKRDENNYLILIVEESEFIVFLQKWADWLQRTHIDASLHLAAG